LLSLFESVAQSHSFYELRGSLPYGNQRIIATGQLPYVRASGIPKSDVIDLIESTWIMERPGGSRLCWKETVVYPFFTHT
jgi:hypothetical protein